MRIPFAAPICAFGLAAQTTPSSILGAGWGLDHVGIAAQNPESLRQLFASEPGFTLGRQGMRALDLITW